MLMKKIAGQLRYEVRNAAQQHSRRGAAAGCRAGDAEREVPLASLREGRHQKCERGRSQEGAS